jgi:hypothetical protein
MDILGNHTIRQRLVFLSKNMVRFLPEDDRHVNRWKFSYKVCKRVAHGGLEGWRVAGWRVEGLLVRGEYTQVRTTEMNWGANVMLFSQTTANQKPSNLPTRNLN